jgi:choline dehydrogenase-like flavoprotein
MRVLRAVAEAMAPGAAGMPAAAGPDGPEPGKVDVAGPLADYLRVMPSRRVLLIKLALRAFEWSPFPWRFSRSSLDARQDFLRRMDGSGSWIRQDLLLLLKVLTGSGYGNDPRVTATVGTTATCRVEGSPSVAFSGVRAGKATLDAPLGSLEPLGDGEDCDFAIVGSGAGGAVVATVLAEAGHDVLVLEAGPYMDRRSYPDEPLAALATLYRDGGLTIAEGLPAIPTPVGRAVGGTTVINSGTCFRAPDHVLAGWQAENRIDWATELDPDFAQAEEMLHVTPVDPERMGRNGQLLMEAAEAMGVSHHPLRRNAGRCVECSSCPYGCRLDAKRAMHVSYLPRAVAAGARVRAGVEARRVELEGERAIGVSCVAGVADPKERRGRPYAVRARKGVIVAGGAFGTPELLMRSGVRSRSGQLGRNLRIHPACWVGARFNEEVRGWEGVMQSYAVDEWQAEGLLLEATFTPLAFGGHWMPGTGVEHQERLASYSHIASTGVHLSDQSRGRVGIAGDGSLRISYRLTREDSRKLSFGIARAAELFYAAGATEVYPQLAGLPVLPRNRIPELDAARPPARRMRLEAFHPLGTARMDADSGFGVVDPVGAVHGYRDLHVADGSIFPSSIGVNPMMTIVAMAARVARGLAAT